MTEQEFREYINSIKDMPEFYKLLKQIGIITGPYGKKQDTTEDIYTSIIEYVNKYLRIYDYDKRTFSPDFERFKRFFEQYRVNNLNIWVRDKDGYIDLERSNILPSKITKTGAFTEGWIITTDGSLYLEKQPLNYSGKSEITDNYCRYTSIIASFIAKQLGVEVAQIDIGRKKGPFKILSRNFLKDNEEIVSIGSDEDITDMLIATEIQNIEKELRLRKFPETEINDTLFQFLKQEFVAKLIGLQDQTRENSPLICSIDSEGNKHVRMCPMFDCDFSFHIVKKHFRERKCNNNKADIESFIEQYYDYPQFSQFLEDSCKNLNMYDVFNSIFEATGIAEFKDYQEDKGIMQFITFVNENLDRARKTVKKMREKDEGCELE